MADTPNTSDVLLDALLEYIKFLEKHINKCEAFMLVHGMGARKEDVDKGIQLREEIRRALTLHVNKLKRTSEDPG